MQKTKKFLSILCALCLLITGYSNLLSYAILAGTHTYTLTASDGNTYRITVTYDESSGIPDDAVLKVREITEEKTEKEVKSESGGIAVSDPSASAGEESEYEKYVGKSARVLGLSEGDLSFIKVFDISLTDAVTGEEYQPNKNVKVSIQLLNDNFDRYSSVDVIHIHDDTNTADVMDCSVNGDTLEFETDGFSVYVLSSPDVFTYDYVFWLPNADVFYIDETVTDTGFTVSNWTSVYSIMPVQTDKGTVTVQTVKNGETPVIPQLTALGNEQVGYKQFAGWYVGRQEGSTLVFDRTAYDFDHVKIDSNETINLYPRYSTFVNIVFHDQYDKGTESYPVMLTRRGELINGSAKIQINDVTSIYRGGEELAFWGWSTEKVEIPGDPDFNGNMAEPDENGCLTVSSTLHLYPVFKTVHWLSYYSAYTGSGATYVPAASYFENEGPKKLTVPSWEGHEFEGWFNGRVEVQDNGDGTKTDIVSYDTQITDANGEFVFNLSGAEGVVLHGDTLCLTADTRLFAKWSDETISYKVIVWKEKTTDAFGTEDKTYDFYKCYIEKEVPSTVYVSVSDDYKQIEDLVNAGFVCGSFSPETELSDKGYTVLEVWYDLSAAHVPTEQNHTLSFVDSLTGEKFVEYSGQVAYGTPILTGNSGASYVPAEHGAKIKGYEGQDVFTFTGWFADKICSTQVFFSEEEYNAYTGYNKKVLYNNMPDEDLTLYAGWSAIWYIVNIDPNYGSLEGVGSTWFWETFDGDLVEEYTKTKRDYVHSSSGEYYYVKHDRAFYGYSGNEWDNSEPDRDVYYTEDVSLATEDTTFEYVPGLYTYAGWYEVLEDGTEVLYDFSKHVDHDLTIKLHWKKNGVYYIEYDYKDADGNNAIIADGTVYSDQAGIPIVDTVANYDGYVFVGWKIKGDPSGRIYRIGDTFTLDAEYAVTVKGKEMVYLEAAYIKAETAKIIYDANGGTVATPVDFGHPSDTNAPVPITNVADGKATISNLVNNSAVYLSDGTGFTRENMTIAGWSTVPNYNPDKQNPFYALGGEYGVDTAAPVTLYAVWKVTVTYHLNNDNANWNGDWTGYTENTENGETTYSREVYLGNAVPAPADVPAYSGADLMFYFWAADPSSNTPYGFSAAVTEKLDLHAIWGEPKSVKSYAVDASEELLEDVTEKTGWAVTDITNIGALPKEINGSYVNAPQNYTFAFAAASADANSITENNAIKNIYYNTSAHELYVTYKNDTTAPLGSNKVYFVFYENKTVSIKYMSMNSQGVLNDIATLSPAAVTSIENLVSADMTAAVTSPLAWANNASLTYYSFAVGNKDATDASGDFNASDLRVTTDAANSDTDRPAMFVRNTWRGLQVSENGTTWMNCEYDQALFVVYYEQQPTIVMIENQTIGSSDVMDTEFEYNFKITQTSSNDPENPVTVYEGTHKLSSGEMQSAVLFYGNAGGVETTQTITVTQIKPETGFTTVIDTESGSTEGKVWTYTTNGASIAQNVLYTNTQSDMKVEVHVAVIDPSTKTIVPNDSLRSDNYSFSIIPGANKVFLTEKAQSDVFSGDTDIYAFGAVMLGTDDGNTVTPESIDVDSVSFEVVDESGVCELILKDKNGKDIASLGDCKVYYLYYPMPQIKYVKVLNDGTLMNITGKPIEGTPSVNPTYNGAEINLNGYKVVQNEKFAFPISGIKITQDVGTNTFRMPAILDDGQFARYLSYVRLGAGADSVSSISGVICSTSSLTLYIRINGGAIEWSTDKEFWTEFDILPTIYAIYEERGYDLQISKTVPTIDKVGGDPEFTVIISSPAITKNSYTVEGYTESTVIATPATDTEPGKITLSIYDGSKVKIKGLGQGKYTITEKGNYNYTLTAKSGPLTGNVDNHNVINNSELAELTLDRERRVELTNTSVYICRVNNTKFYTLQSAMEYIAENYPPSSEPIEIQMIRDYVMPSSDQPVIPAGYTIKINSASDGVFNKNYATITRDKNFTSGAMMTNNGTLIIDAIVLDGGYDASTNDEASKVKADTAMIVSTGAVRIINGALLHNAYNESGNGGAICATGGTVEVIESSINDNYALAGGAVYSTGASVVLTGTNKNDSTTLNGNKAENGGAVYYDGTGTVSIQPYAYFEGNYATVNGGAVYAKTGVVAVTGGSLTANIADANGGAIYTENGAVEVSGSTIGGTGSNDANKAVNGAAIFVDRGTATITGGTITGNKATQGGAVGVGSENARLYFSDKPNIYGNKMGTEESNVYLDQNTDVVINAAGINDGTVGIYVPGDMDNGKLFQDRGVPGAKFGVFTNDKNVTKIKNDRLPGLTVTTDSDTKRLIWGKAIEIQIRYLEKYDSGFPHKESGSWNGDRKLDKDWTTYYLPSYNNASSEIGDDLRLKYTISSSTKTAFAYAFLDDGSDNIGFENYVTDVSWSNVDNAWKFTKRNGDTATGTKLVVYFSEPTYINIENNSPYPLEINDLVLRGYHVLNTADQVGYGYVFAINGAIQSKLMPVTTTDFTLAVGKSIKLMFPGGVASQSYTLTGGFTTDGNEKIRVRQDKVTGFYLEGTDRNSFTLPNGITSDSNGGTVSVIFGGDKMICKIVLESADGISTGDYDGFDEETSGGSAYMFKSIKRAVAFAAKYKTDATIEMLVDYLIPSSDSVKIPTGLDLTFTTAYGPTEFDYNFLDPDSLTPEQLAETELRATISRDNSHQTSFIIVENGGYNTLTFKDLRFDGKNFSGSINGGVIKTKNSNVVIDNCDFVNCIANNGGGIYIDFTETAESGGTLKVTNTLFKNCESQSTAQRQGGGAIWTSAEILLVAGCRFEFCKGKDQGGAIFHRIDTTKISNYTPHAYAKKTVTIVTDTDFINCEGRSGGAVESDAHHVIFGRLPADDQYYNDNVITKEFVNDLVGADKMGDCSFENCKSIKVGSKYGSGGAIATYIYEKSSYISWGRPNANGKNGYYTYLTIIGCDFKNCTTTGSNKAGFGGGIRSQSITTLIEDCSFTGCSATNSGGGISINNEDELSLIIVNTEIKNNSTQTNGGGIYLNCPGIEHFILKDCEISNNTAAKQGGGVYTNSLMELINTKITNNHLTTKTVANAAGVYLVDRTLLLGEAGSTTVDKSSISGNTVSGGAESNLIIKGGNIADSIIVRCNLDVNSRIGVINHGNLGEQFGSSIIARPNGLSAPTDDSYPTIVADDGTVYGIIDRSDHDGKRIIWGGPPICKITDENNNILYLDEDANYPAVFDTLEDGKDAGLWTSAFAFLRAPVLYNSDGSEYTAKTYCVQMLIEKYQSTRTIFTDDSADKTIILTTASSSDTIYPYRGTKGTVCTIIRSGSSFVGEMFSVKCNMTFKGITIDGASLQSDGSLTSSANGGLIVVAGTKDITCTLGENAVLQNSHTTGNGGAVCVANGNFEMTGTLRGGTIQNCKADGDGGAIYMNADLNGTSTNGKVRLEIGNISFCEANNGGAVYVNKGYPTLIGISIRSCKAETNGGAICLMPVSGANSKALMMTGGTISDCEAKNGSGGGIYVGNGSNFNMSGGFIMDNKANTRGGGVAIDDSTVTLTFSKTPWISGNTCTASVADGNACNLELSQDSNAIITTDGIWNGARIGVYVPGEDTEGNNSLYDKHGEEGDPFGTYRADKDTSFLYAFTNDRNGLKGGTGDTPHVIYWVKSFSIELSKTVENRKTDDNGNEIYDTFRFKVTLYTYDANGNEINADISSSHENPTLYGDLYFTNGVATHRVIVDENNNTTLSGNDEYFELKDGETITIENLPYGINYIVEEFLTYGQQKEYVGQNGSDMRGAVGENIGLEIANRYQSVVNFVNQRPVCKITSNDGALLYYKKDVGYNWFNTQGELRTKSITRNQPAVFMALKDAFEFVNNGNNPYKLYIKNGNNYVEYKKNSSNNFNIELLESCTIATQMKVGGNRTVTLTTAEVNADTFPYHGNDDDLIATVKRDFVSGTFINVNNNGRLTLKFVTMDGNKDTIQTKANGGIIIVSTNGKLFINNGAKLVNSGLYKDYNGGAVYVASGGEVTMTGGEINGNTVTQKTAGKGVGAGIYLSEGAALHISGNPNFGGEGLKPNGSLDTSKGNIKDNVERQDIYIAGYEGADGALNAASLIVDGDINSGNGTIWVWAEKTPHYITLQQFAVIKENVTITEETCKVFRNARPDEDTENNDNEYLHGTLEGDTPGYVYWSGIRGKRKIILRKVSEDYDSLTGAGFDIIKQNGVPYRSELVSSSNGVFFIGTIPYGTYLIHETTVPNGVKTNEGGWWYVLVVEQDKTESDGNVIKGVYLLTDNSGNQQFSSQTNAEQALSAFNAKP